MSRLSQWEKLVASGGADDLFMSHPNNDELAEKINGLFKGDDLITSDIISSSRQRFHELPRRGNKREEKLASPTKNVILNKAKQLNVFEAIAEIIDNIFDNFERNTNRTKLDIEITVYAPTDSSSGEIIIQENSGGIPNERIVPLIQLGTDSIRTNGGIGAWGEGFKMAIFALGEEVDVFSTYSSEKPVAIHFPKGWLEPGHVEWTTWKVTTYEVTHNPLPDGSTMIRIKYLHPQVIDKLGLGLNSPSDTKTVCDELASYLGEVYSEKYHSLVAEEQQISIKLNIAGALCKVAFLDTVEERLGKNLAFLPWLLPIKWKRIFEIDLEGEDRKKARLEMIIFAGLTATEHYSPSFSLEFRTPGVEMWGNGRKFSLKGRITDESAGWGYSFGKGSNPASGSSYRRLTIVALFSSTDSRDIPWAAPVKNDYNRRSEFYAEIQKTLARSIRLFKDAHNLLEFVFMIFSASWSQLKEDQKLQILFGDVEANSRAINRFKSTRFGRKLLAYKPNLHFKEINQKIDEPAIKNLYGIEAAQIANIVKAAKNTKQTVGQRIEFLKAIFPNLNRQAEIEEQLQLSGDEEFSDD